MTTLTAQESAARAESTTTPQPGRAERFAGYAVMGVPFSTGHYLAFRRFPASSIGPGYQAVWLRTPDGQWTIHADAPPELSCARYFGKALKEARQTPVLAAWTGPWNLTVTVPGVVQWELEMKSSAMTTAATAAARHLPAPLWHRDNVLKLMGRLMGPALGMGAMNFAGSVPNGQSFQAKPLRVWSVRGSQASIGGLDAGTPQALAVQDRLGDFWLPQRGLFVAELSLCFPSTATTPPAAHTVNRGAGKPPAMSIVQTLPERQADGLVGDLYAADVRALGYVPSHTKVLGLNPEAYVAWRALQGAIAGSLGTRRYELVTLAAARALASGACLLAHGRKAATFMGEEALIQLCRDHHAAGLSAAEVAMMDFATKVSTGAAAMDDADSQALRNAGFSDREIVDIALAAAARNYFSKALQALAVDVDVPPGLSGELQTALLAAAGRPARSD